MASKDPTRIVLSQQILRNLGDRSYEKRKQAAIEIEHLIRDLNPSQSGNTDRIKAVIHSLVVDYAYSTQPNNRKGGLIGLSAIAIALMDNASTFLELLLPPVLKCFTDPEARVRYYACEALYNIAKVARGHVLLFFNEIFDGLCKLFADMDVDVKSGAQLLDRLIKDIVTESEAFDVERFIPLLRERIRIKNAFIRQLLVGWVAVLDSVPDIDMLEFLPEYLGGLFDMLSDPNKDIRQQAYAALAELLRQISMTPQVELGSMVLILVQQCDNKDNFTRLTVLTWIHEFLQIGKAKLLPFVPDLLGAIFACFSDIEREIRQKAQKCQDVLLRLVEETTDLIDLSQILKKTTAQLLNRWVPARLSALRWLAMLLTKMNADVVAHLDDIFPALLQTLQDVDDQVVRLDLEVLARISLNSEGKLEQSNFNLVLVHLLKLFASDIKFLELRGSLIIRQLSLLLNGEAIYRALSRLLCQHEDLEFASLMVQTLNLILLTSTELFELRATLKQSMLSPQGRALFSDLYTAWCHNPVATLSLCLLAESYELSAPLVVSMAEIEVTVGFLLQLDKLVQLLESPIFVNLRLQLLEPHKHPLLIKSLYGILMLLPQSTAFTSLKTRLASVSPLASLDFVSRSTIVAKPLHREQFTTSPVAIDGSITSSPSASLPSSSPSSSSASSSSSSSSSSTSLSSSEASMAELQALLDQFVDVQRKHQLRRKQLSRQASLLESSCNKPPAATTTSSSLLSSSSSSSSSANTPISTSTSTSSSVATPGASAPPGVRTVMSPVV